MHTVNNIGVFVVTVTIGGWAEAFVGEETRGTPIAFGVSVLLHGIALALDLVAGQEGRSGPVVPPGRIALPTAGPGSSAVAP